MSLLNHNHAKTKRLHELKMFEHSSRKALEHLAAAADEIEAPAGTVLLEEGSRCHDAYILTEGSAVMAVHGDQFVEIGPGHVVGELSLLEYAPAVGTVTCTTDVKALAIPHTLFGLIMHENPDLTLTIAKQLADRVVLQDPQIDEHEYLPYNDDGIPQYH